MTDENKGYIKETLGRNEENTGTEILLRFGESIIRYAQMDDGGFVTTGAAVNFSTNDMTPEEKAVYEANGERGIVQAALIRIRTIENAEKKEKEEAELKESMISIEFNDRPAAIFPNGKDKEGNDQYVFTDGNNIIHFVKTADGMIGIYNDDSTYDESIVREGLDIGKEMGLALDKALNKAAAAKLKAGLKTTTLDTTKPSDVNTTPEPHQQSVQNGNALEQVQNQSRANEVSARNAMEANQSARTAPNNSQTQTQTRTPMARDDGGR